MRRMQAAAIIAIAALAMPAIAQVHKCNDKSSRTIYSDAPCAPGQSGGLLERRRTDREVFQERIQAAEAEDRKQLQRMIEQEREWSAQSQRAAQHWHGPSTSHNGSDWAKRKELANAATSKSSITKNGSGWDNSEETRRARAARQAERRAALPPPTNITSCSGGFCNDNQGGQYHRISPDFMAGQNGQACHRTGDMWNCN